jgi:hypothetical protein
MTAAIDNWIANEVKFSDFGDQRLSVRFGQIMWDCLKNPLAPLNQTAIIPSKVKASYRFFQNKKVTPEKILLSHSLATARRCEELDAVLSTQDTTAANFHAHSATKGLGHIGSSPNRPDSYGIHIHTNYCFDVQGNPLGIIAQEQWERKIVHTETRDQRKTRLRNTPLEQKESMRWINSATQARQRIPEQTRVIHVADREGDFFELMGMLKADPLNSFIIRAKSDRRVSDDSDDYDVFLLSESFSQEKPITSITVEIEGNSKRESRSAEVSIYSKRVSLLAPERNKSLKTKFSHSDTIEVTAVFAVENDPPKGVERVSWLLLTDMTVEDAAMAIQIVKWYTLRWRIEEFHKILKSGCKIEDCRLETAKRLENFITLKSIVAHRILELTYYQRTNPEAPSSRILSEQELRCLHLRVKGIKKSLPKSPTVKDVVRAIAQLGGFLGRKGDGEPGITTIWRGWTLFQESVAMFNLMTSEPSTTYG